MSGLIKKFLLLSLLWSGFGFALNEYLDTTSMAANPNETSPIVTQSSESNASTMEFKNTAVTAQNSAVQTNTDLSESPADGLVEDEQDPDIEPDTPPEILMDNRPLVLGADVISIVPNTPEVVWQSDWQALVDQLTYNMNINPDLTLEIIGRFDPSEPIADPNLGIQRSVRVKNKLVATGINADRISCRAELQRLFTDNTPPAGLLIRPSSALLPTSSVVDDRNEIQKQDAPEREKPVSLVKTEYKTNPNLPRYNSIVYQPTFSDQGVVVDNKLIDLIPEIKQWLALDAKHYIDIVGHTDHVGHDQDNYRLALKWAQQVRRFFISEGLASGRMRARSAGEQQPLYTNSNSRGREKNRRVELIFKF